MWYVKNRCMNSEQRQNILLWPYLKVPEVKSIAENMKNRLKKIIFPFFSSFWTKFSFFKQK